jgi:hypothetical protein
MKLGNTSLVSKSKSFFRMRVETVVSEDLTFQQYMIINKRER